MPSKWMKNNTEDIIWWLDNGADTKGEWVFSFDKKRRFNMFADYPWKLPALGGDPCGGLFSQTDYPEPRLGTA